MSDYPKELKAVLAKIFYVGDLGASIWHQVIYWDGEWKNYAGDRAFTGGEQVKAWVYADEAMKVKSQEHQWIPVSERLPEETGSFLVIFDDGDHTVSNFHKDEMEWYYTCEFTGEVTHWMPLPAAPEE